MGTFLPVGKVCISHPKYEDNYCSVLLWLTTVILLKSHHTRHLLGENFKKKKFAPSLNNKIFRIFVAWKPYIVYILNTYPASEVKEEAENIFKDQALGYYTAGVLCQNAEQKIAKLIQKRRGIKFHVIWVSSMIKQLVDHWILHT